MIEVFCMKHCKSHDVQEAGGIGGTAIGWYYA